MCLCHERALSGGATRNESGTGERAIARSAWKGYRQEAAHYKSHSHFLLLPEKCVREFCVYKAESAGRVVTTLRGGVYI